MISWVVFYVFARKVPRTNRSGHYAYMLFTRCMGVLGMLESFLPIRTTLSCRLSRGPFNPLETPPLHPFLHFVFRCPSNGHSSGCSAYLWPSNGDCVTWLFRLSVERDAAHNRILCLVHPDLVWACRSMAVTSSGS